MSQRLKHCKRCNTNKPLKKFRKDKNSPSGRSSWCSECLREYDRARNKSRYRTPEKNFEATLRQKYGLTVADFEQMLEKQDRVCAICGNPPSGNGPVNSRLNVDHCHRRGNVRALLCRRCNNLLGFAQDDIALLKDCIDYLKRWGDDLYHNA